MSSRKHVTWKGKSYLVDWSNVADAPKGVAILDYTPAEDLLFNRAGKDETCLSLNQLFDWLGEWPEEMNNPPLGRNLFDFSDEENNIWFNRQKGTGR